MPAFTLTATAAAPVEEVWKLLHDPALFPQWWAGVETVRRGEGGDYTMWPTGYPDFPMAQQLRSAREDARVTIRNIRRKAMEELHRIVRDGEAGEDEVARAEKELQGTTDRYVHQVDDLVKHKESELLEV